MKNFFLDCLSLEGGTDRLIGCPETLATNYQSVLHHMPEEQISIPQQKPEIMPQKLTKSPNAALRFLVLAHYE